MHHVVGTEFKLHGLCHYLLIIKDHFQKGNHHDKGEESKEGPQDIVQNILYHKPFIGNQVIQKPEKSFHIYSPV